MPGVRGSMTERFWAKVDKRNPDECWPWLGAIYEDGYGRLNTGGRNGQDVTASRAAYFVGTRLDNMQDASMKRRIPRAERCVHTKLTREQAQAAVNDPRTIAVVAAEFGVSTWVVQAVRAGKTWPDIDRPMNKIDNRTRGNPR